MYATFIGRLEGVGGRSNYRGRKRRRRGHDDPGVPHRAARDAYVR